MLDQLKSGISLRAYGQKDPVLEFKYESYDMFEAMTRSISCDTAKTVLNVTLRQPVAGKDNTQEAYENTGGDGTVKKQPVKSDKVGRNDPCPCGSGKKYKKCCGQ